MRQLIFLILLLNCIELSAQKTQKLFYYVIPGIINGDAFVIRNIPEGIKATVVGLNFENGKSMFASKEIGVSQKTQAIDLKFKEVTLEELKQFFKSLDD